MVVGVYVIRQGAAADLDAAALSEIETELKDIIAGIEA